MNVYFVKLPVNFYFRDNVVKLSTQRDGEAMISVYFRLLFFAGIINQGGEFVDEQGVAYEESVLAKHIGKRLDSTKKCLAKLQESGLLGCRNGTYYIVDWDIEQSEDKLKKIREQNRLRKQRQREKNRQECHESHAHVTQENKNQNKNKNYDYNKQVTPKTSYRMEDLEWLAQPHGGEQGL